MFSVGRKAGRRSAALHVNDHQRQFGDDGKTYALTLERQTGAGSGSHCQIAGKRCAYGRAYAGNLVFHLAGLDTKIFTLGKLMQDVSSRSDGIRTEEQRASGLLGSHNQPPSGRSIAIYVSVHARTRIFGLDTVCRHLGKFLGNIVAGSLYGAVEEPAYDA